MTSLRDKKIDNSNSYHENRPSLLINTISNWVALGVNIIIAFFLIPYIIRCLGVTQYGIWILVISIIGYYGLLDMGITAAILRYVARYTGKRDYNALNQIVNSALLMFSVIGIVVALFSLIAVDSLANFFSIEIQDYNSFKKIVWLLGLTAGLLFPCSVLAVIILAHERFVIANTVKIVTAVLRGGLSFVALYCGGGLAALGLIYVCTTMFAIVANMVVIKLYFKHVNIRFGSIKKDSARVLISFGFFSFIIKAGMLLRTKLGAVVVGRYLDMNSVGIYGVTILLYRYLAQLTVSCSGVTQPRLAAIAGQDARTNFANYVMIYSVFVSTFAVGMGLIAFLLCKDFLQLWLPENFKDINTSALAFYILLFGLVPEMMSGVSSNALEAIKKHPFHAYQAIVEGIASLILLILLVSKFGIVGAALGTAIPALLAKLISQPIYCCRVIRMNWFNYMERVFLRPFLIAAFLAILFQGNNILFSAKSYLQLIVKALIVLSLYTVLAYVFCFDSKNRRIISDTVLLRRRQHAEDVVL